MQYTKELFNSFKEELKQDDPDFSQSKQLISRQKLAELANWDGADYNRLCLGKNEDFELILICWNPGSETPIHDHNQQRCWVFFFDAPIEESYYCKEGINHYGTNSNPVNSVSFMSEGGGCHQLKNTSNEQIMTLHLYNKPIEECKILDPDTEEMITTELSYHSV